MELVENIRAVTSQIDYIINAFWNVFKTIFTVGDQMDNGYMGMVIQTIMNNEYLLISLTLVICGFVIGIIRRIITV